MALPGAVVAGMAAVLIAVIGDAQRAGRECGAQSRLDFGGYHAHILFSCAPALYTQPPANPQGLAAISDDPPEAPAGAPRRTARLHGRIERAAGCDHRGCRNLGEFRAPVSNRAPGSEGGWQFLCLEHVRAFNAGYNFFDGLSPDEIIEAQSPLAGWEQAATPKGRMAFSFGDAHDLFGGESRPRQQPQRWSGFGDAQALRALGLDDAATADEVRRTYKRLVRRYHPDSNEGDRSMEGKLQAVVNAYTHLKSASAFKTES